MKNMELDEKNLEFLEHYGVKGMRWGVRKRAGPGLYKQFKSGGGIRGSVKRAKAALDEADEARAKKIKTETTSFMDEVKSGKYGKTSEKDIAYLEKFFKKELNMTAKDVKQERRAVLIQTGLILAAYGGTKIAQNALKAELTQKYGATIINKRLG